ncbi:hypothetical protein DM860_009158 [Cuscuta australis]|uniref:Uncharacterized protein n=1 Tax=Cuscuta australis TaxID=267555 RepID=A0A328DEI7_9ASTE|nr:hypothetical protein DM860_009158 [Cuscuta australis]
MKKSPINSKLEQHHQHYEFDPHSDFEQFLAEGRNHARRVTLDVTSHLQESCEKKKMGKKSSWKRSLFSWLKREKKTKNGKKGMKFSMQRNECVSGPVNFHGSEMATAARLRKTVSGPITNLFSGEDKDAKEIVPYICLGKMNTPKVVQSYGPVYLVT